MADRFSDRPTHSRRSSTSDGSGSYNDPDSHRQGQYASRLLQPDGEPATPAYRRVAAESTTGLPPDYRSQYVASRETLDEKEGSSSRYHTASSKNVHYPDTDGRGRLHNITPRQQKFPSNSPSTSPVRPGHSRASSLAGSDIDDDEEEIYDWSDEDDLVDQEAKFDKVRGADGRRKGWGPIRVFTFFFSTLLGSVFLAGAFVAAAILVRRLWLKPHRTDHREYVADNLEAWFFWVSANVVVSWALASLIDLAPHVFTLLVNIIWGTVSEALKAKLELYDSGRGWIKPLFYAGSAWASWVILFEGVFKLYDGRNEGDSRAGYTPRVYQVIRFLFFLTVVVCVEKMLLQMIAFTFHRTAYMDRLDEVAKATKTLDHLKDYRPKRHGGSGTHTPMRSSVFGLSALGGGKITAEPGPMEEGRIKHDDSDSEDEHDRKQPKKGFLGFKIPTGPTSGSSSKNVSRQSSRLPLQAPPAAHVYPPLSSSGANTPRGQRMSHEEAEHVLHHAARALKTAVLHDARGLRGDTIAEEDFGPGLSSAHEAKKLARNLYNAFRSDKKRTYLIPQDFYPAYPTPEEAKEAFKIFDKDGNGDISRAEIKTTVMMVYKERRFLARSLRDVSAAMKTLDHMMLAVFCIILIFIALPIFGISITKSFSSIYTVFIAASFIFKNSASNTFDSIMFTFVTHPFDTGDRVFIDDENLVVRKMGLFATTFTRVDGTQTYYFNSMLLNKFIQNARRSGNMSEACELQVSWRTPQWKLDALEKKMNEWIDSDEKRWFKPQTSIGFSKIDFQRALYLNIGIGHNGTWQDWGMRLARKTAFHAACNFYCRQLDITYSESPQAVVLTDKTDMPFVDEQPDEPVTPKSAMPPPDPSEDKSTDTAPHTMLGFTPPRGQTQLRLRKGNKKKLLGAAEGDM